MFSHILVPLDGSVFAESALPYAFSLVEKYGAEITLLRVVNPLRWQSMMELEAPDLHERLMNSEIKEATAYLDSQQEGLAAEGKSVCVHIEKTGLPVAEAILSMVDGLGADMIVMSTHGRSGLQRWVFGSVAERVVRLAEIPTMLVRPQKAEEC